MNLTKLAVSERLGRFVVQCREQEPPAEVLEKLRCNLLHDFSVAMAAHAEGPSIWGVARGHAPAESTVLCLGERVDAEHAAFANAALMHARAQDDTHYAAKTHVGSAVIPAALAAAERSGADGAAFARATIAGYEVAAAVGERLAAASTARGFRASMLYGTLGAAAASAALLGLDEEATASAIAIASSFSGGLNQTWIEGSTEWRWELGMAARNGLWAATLAASGAVGAREWYEGAAGFVRAFAGEDEGGEWELGERWRILDVIYKPYPVCNITQSPVEAAIGLVGELDIEPDEVESIRCMLNPADRSYPGTLNWGPFTDVGSALMSAPFCVAMAVKHRNATLAGLHETEDSVIRELVARTEVLADERLPTLAARIELTTLTGDRRVRELVPDDDTYGWSWDGVKANSNRLLEEMAVGPEALDRLEQALRGIQDLDSVAPLVEATVA
ncbi:MAG: MmgE/PrpD family protein [Solirubrobacterales bacterium]